MRWEDPQFGQRSETGEVVGFREGAGMTAFGTGIGELRERTLAGAATVGFIASALP